MKALRKILIFLIGILLKIYKKSNINDFNARFWSNLELRRIAPYIKGDIINVSAGTDSDKQGNYYRDYFGKKSSYNISNYKKTNTGDKNNEIILNLEEELPKQYIDKFDAVLTHTVLEHVFDIDKAISNLCLLSKDIVITIVPFLQSYHHEEDTYYDFWRFSPLVLIKKFDQHNFKTLYCNWNNDLFGNIYIVHVASLKPENWNNLKDLNIRNKLNYSPGFRRQQFLSNSKSESARTMFKSFNSFMD